MGFIRGGRWGERAGLGGALQGLWKNYLESSSSVLLSGAMHAGSGAIPSWLSLLLTCNMAVD